ncbi:MAG: helix-turn-helix domain-containing protein [Acutalibacteraceae bacterium]
MVKNLKPLRQKKGLSQQQLADIIGVSQQSVYKYEKQNVEPELSVLISMADYFETSVDYLIGHSDVNHKIEKIQPFELNAEEAKLIRDYRKLSKSEKESINLVIKNYRSKK